MVIIGYIGFVIVGMVLGLIGGGGAILTVPILVYLFSVNPLLATSYSLLLVGWSAAIGARSYYAQELVDSKTATSFALVSWTVMVITRSFLMPLIPEVLAEVSTFQITKPMLIMVVFALIMLVSSLSMIRGESVAEKPLEGRRFMIPVAMITGAITGFVGAGGGFMIIPALIYIARLDMKKAVGTSLLIIAINSLLGFSADMIISNIVIDWKFVLPMLALAALGMFIGGRLSRSISGAALKPAFGWFVLLMGSLILVKEIFFS